MEKCVGRLNHRWSRVVTSDGFVHCMFCQMPRKVTTKELLSEIQDSIGRAQGAYLNDRASDRADQLLPALERAFEFVLMLRAKYKD